MDRLQRKRGWIWADGWKERLMTAHAKQMSRESSSLKRSKLKTKRDAAGTSLSHKHSSACIFNMLTETHKATWGLFPRAVCKAVHPYCRRREGRREAERDYSVWQHAEATVWQSTPLSHLLNAKYKVAEINYCKYSSSGSDTQSYVVQLNVYPPSFRLHDTHSTPLPWSPFASPNTPTPPLYCILWAVWHIL